MKKNHITKLKPKKNSELKNSVNGLTTSSVFKTKDTGLACVPSGDPPFRSL